MAEIYPKYGDEKRIAQVLLALADNVMDVRTTSDSGFAFVVPEDLHEKFLRHEAGIREEEAVVPNTDLVKRRPGRPRKVDQPKEDSE